MRALLVCALLTSCGGGADYPMDCPSYRDQEYGFSYQIDPEFRTSQGVQVDPTGQDISPELVDRLTNEVQTCLAESFPNGIPQTVMAAGRCENGFGRKAPPFRRDCFSVKVPDTWSWSSRDPNQQVLADDAPDYVCVDKGLCSGQCECRWRAGLQGRAVVTTPSFYLYKDALVRLATGCSNPWGSPELARCAMPSTEPNSLGN